MLIFYLKNRENIKTPNYNNLAHLPIIIPSITRATTTNRIRTMFINNIINIPTTTTTSISSAFNNNHGIGTVIHALSNFDLLTASTISNKSSSTSSSTKYSSYSAMDDNNGNIMATASINADINGNVNDNDNNNNKIDNKNTSINSIRVNNRNRREIRITENPIAETIVC